MCNLTIPTRTTHFVLHSLPVSNLLVSIFTLLHHICFTSSPSLGLPLLSHLTILCSSWQSLSFPKDVNILHIYPLVVLSHHMPCQHVVVFSFPLVHGLDHIHLLPGQAAEVVIVVLVVIYII